MTDLSPSPKFRAFYPGTSIPLVGGFLYTYAAGTSPNPANYQATYKDSAGTTNTNPVVLDSSGECDLWVGTLSYKYVLKDSVGNTIWTVDNVVGGSGAIAAAVSALFVGTFAALATTAAVLNQTVTLIKHTSGSLGGGTFMAVPSSGLTLDGGTVSISATAGIYWQRVNYKVLTPDEFGALGDGSANDAAPLQLALDSGKNISVLKGRAYLTNTRLLLKSDRQILTIDGSIKATAAITSVIESIDYDYVTINGSGLVDANSLAISGITFTASAKNPTGAKCLGVTITKTAIDINLYYGGLLIVNTGGAAGAFRNKNVTVDGVTAINCGTHGVLAAYVDGFKIVNCTLQSCTNHGHESVGCSDVVIDGNTAIDCIISGVGVGARTFNFAITNNTIRNCGGDGSITCEQNSIRGVIANNSIYNCITNGINVSYGTAGAAPFDKLRSIVVKGNVVVSKAGFGFDKAGILVYSSTGPGIGIGINVVDNVVDGFNIGVDYLYCYYGSISGNLVLNPTGVGNMFIRGTLINSVDISNNKCSSDTDDHAIQIVSYAGTDSTNVNISGNQIASSKVGAKALIFIYGVGRFLVIGNSTDGSISYVTCAAAATVLVRDNYGNVTTTYAGGGIFNNELGTGNGTTVGAAGGATALPATPKGYTTTYIPSVGIVKVPYYNV